MDAILVGYGLAGQVFHAPLMAAAGIRIQAVAVNHPARRALAAQHHPQAILCDTLEHALTQSNAPLVVLASPTATHAPLSIQALQAGRHVVVDKPVALSKAELQSMIEAAENAQRHLIPFQNRRWDADFLSLQELIKQDQLGEIVRYEARFDRYNPVVKDRWREHDVAGGGLLYDLAPHLVDQTNVLFGAPDWVFCTLLTQRDGAQTNDGFELIMGANGRDYPYITLGASTFSAAADQAHGAPRYKVSARKATWLKSGFDPQEAALRIGQIPQSIAWMTEDDAARGRLIDGITGTETKTPAGVGQWPWFYTCTKSAITSDHAPPVLATQALVTCAVIDAAIESFATGRRVDLS